MGVEVLRPLWLFALLLGLLLWWAWRRWPPPLERQRSRLVLASRLLLVALLVFALAGVRLTTQPTKRALVAVVDLSASVKAGGGLEAEAKLVRALQAAKGPDDLFGVVSFGRDTAVELPLTRDPAFESFQTQPDPSYTNIAGALRLAAGLIPDGYARQLVLVSDGRQNLDDAAGTVAALRSEGVRVDVLPVGGAPRAEALVAGLEVAPQIRIGQTAVVTVNLRSQPGPAVGHLVLIVDGTQVAAREVALPAGSSTQTFQLPDLPVGLHRVRAELTADPDTYPENNVGEAAVRVLGRPLVLILEGRPGEGENVARALQAGGMEVERRPALAAPTDTATLGRYDSVVVVDAAADSFPKDSLAALARAVHDLGKGLVTMGGPNAYGPGGWKDTPLEEALPLRMDIPNRKDKPKVAVVLVMETMEDQQADQVVLGAAEAVIDKLSADDQVAVTDGRAGFVVPMTPARDKKAIEAKLEAATLGDAPSYLPFLQMAVQALLRTDAPLKHIVVLGDGDPDLLAGQQQQVQAFLQQSLSQGITTSAVAVDVHGQPQYMSYMQDIARSGGGRFYLSNNPSQVPQLFLKESITALRPWYEQEPFFPKIAASGDLLQGVATDAFPQLGGYVVTTPKPGAEQYLISPKNDPVLAAWSYGLGRAVAWTSDASGRWTGGFLRSPVSAQLFARMVAWTLPGAGGQLSIDAQPSGDGLQVTVSGPPGSSGNLHLGVVRPDLQGQSQDLLAVAPGRWQGRLEGTPVGVYLLHATLEKGGQVRGSADAAVSVPYSPEYLQLGRDDAFLGLLARAGAGRLLSGPERAWSQPTPPVPVSTDVFWVLLLVVALIWPLDVAARRITIRPRQLLANVVEYLRERRMSELEVAAPEELVRLRSRIQGVRRRGVPPATKAAPGAARAKAGRGQESEPPRPPTHEKELLSARLLQARRKRRGPDS